MALIPSVLTMVVLAVLIGLVLSYGSGVYIGAGLLVAAPGGIAEMSLTAKVLRIGVAFVTAGHVMRYLMVVILAPYYRHVVKNRQVKAFVSGVTAAATGAIAGAVFVLGKRAIVDVPTVLIGAVALGVILFTKKVPEPVVILAAGVAGVVLKTTGLA